VIELAISQDAVVGGTVLVSLAISTTNGFSEAKIIQFGSGDAVGDLALLETSGSMLPPGAGKARFATPLRYNDRQFAVLGFSDGAGEGLPVEGSFVGPEDRDGLVLMPGEKIRNKGGFHGTPVWSPELEAFVGLVTSSPRSTDAAACISSRALCSFYSRLLVQFRIPSSDKPVIKDYNVDDPNVDLFGTEAEKNGRRLTATVEDDGERGFAVKMKYEILQGAQTPRGLFVTFITYPDVVPYELFGEIGSDRKVEATCYVRFPDFTIAAVGDGGETRLTFSLATLAKQTVGSQKPEAAKETNAPASSGAGAANAPVEAARVVPPAVSSEKAAGESDANQESSGQAAVPIGYTFGPVGFNSEFCGIGGIGKVEDQLKVEKFAIRLGELIALRETKLPLAVGLFGDWGSGKSYFMNLMDQHMKKLSKETPDDWSKRAAKPNAPLRPDPESKGPWCREIVPVYFNAWHYVDTNLWASLVAHIFESLFGHLKPKVDELEKVQQMLEQASGATARAAEDLELAKREATQAQAELSNAKTEREQQETVVQGMLQGLKTLLPDVGDTEVRKNVAKVLGYEKDLQTFDELHNMVADAKTTAGRTKTFWNSFWGRGWKWRLGWLAAGVAASYFGPKLLMHSDWFKAGREYLAEFLAVVTPLLSLIAVAIAKAKSALTKMEEWESKAREAQQQKLQEDPVVKKADENARAAKKREEAALARVVETETRQKQLKEEALNLTPERRISRFIEQRAQSSDYRGQLGLVSLARRDFEELSNLFTDEKALKKWLAALKTVEEKAEAESKKAEEEAAIAGAEKKENEAAAAKARAEKKKAEAATAKTEAVRLQKASDSIDRIVLFVDDLDRCQTDKVVDVLQAVHLLLAFPLFSVVVGVDQRCLRQSLRQQFSGLMTQNGDNGERPATPLDYLEKIFHIPFHLPPMEKEGFEDLITNLTKPRGETSISSKEEKIGAPPKQPSESTDEMKPELATPSTVMTEDFETKFTTAMPALAARQVKSEKSFEAELAKISPATPDQKSPEKSSKVAEVIGSVPLFEWERTALKAYHSLIKTPRGATRLLNTYRLVRAGIQEGEDWKIFCGDGAISGDFRLAMLLLAVSAGCPAVARDWFAVLRPTDQDKSLNPRELTGNPSKEWLEFKKMYAAIKGDLNPQLTEDRLTTWLNRVERFTF
jgi:hypothetical protein